MFVITQEITYFKNHYIDYGETGAEKSETEKTKVSPDYNTAILQ